MSSWAVLNLSPVTHHGYLGFTALKAKLAPKETE